MQLVPLKQVFVSILLLNGAPFQLFQQENTALAKDRSREPILRGFPAWIPVQSASFGRLDVPSHISEGIL